MGNRNVVACEHSKSGDAKKRKGHLRNEEFMTKLGNEHLEFYELSLSDPTPTARQIIDAAGFTPVDEHLIFEVSHGRRLSELQLDEVTDLRDQGKKFIIFRNDRSWRGVIDGKRFEWGACHILGRVLKWLAGVDPEKFGVWLERKDMPDQLIADDEKVSLELSGVERFRTPALHNLH